MNECDMEKCCFYEIKRYVGESNGVYCTLVDGPCIGFEWIEDSGSINIVPAEPS